MLFFKFSKGQQLFLELRKHILWMRHKVTPLIIIKQKSDVKKNTSVIFKKGASYTSLVGKRDKYLKIQKNL